MRLTTLGTGTIALAPRRACAGHLLEVREAGVRLLMDCGSGVARRLADRGAAGATTDWRDLTHVAITHFHADHVGDLPTLFFAWRYGQRPARSAPLTLIGPPGTRDLLERLAAAFGEWVARPEFPLFVTEIEDGGQAELADGVRLSARKVPHTEESVAYSIEHQGRRVVYTGDTGYDAGLAEWAGGCDLLLSECSLPDRDAMATHLTPRQCGALAAVARPRRLVLSHLYPQLDGVDVEGQVAERYPGAVVVAEDGWSTEIEDMRCWS